MMAMRSTPCIHLKCRPIHIGCRLCPHNISPWWGDTDVVSWLCYVHNKINQRHPTTHPTQPWWTCLTPHVSTWDAGPSTSDANYIGTAPHYDKEMPMWLVGWAPFESLRRAGLHSVFPAGYPCCCPPQSRSSNSNWMSWSKGKLWPGNICSYYHEHKPNHVIFSSPSPDIMWVLNSHAKLGQFNCGSNFRN